MTPGSGAAVGALRSAVRRVQPLVPHARSGIHILAYHLVGAGTDSPVDLPEAIFRHQMEELADRGRVVSLTEALARLQPDQDPGPDLGVVLTFDDAYANFRSRVWPVLEELALPATLYVPTGFLEGRCPGPLAGARGLPPLVWSELRDLAASDLLTVGSHSDTHPDLPGLAADRVDTELRTSQEILEDRLQRPVRDFCYPRAHWDRGVEARVANVYRSAAIAGGTLNRAGRTPPLRLRRTPVRRDMPSTLAPVLARSVWIEEWLAARWRSLRRWGLD